MKNYQRLEGLVAAVFTPMNQNGEINLEAIDKYAQYLIQSGITGVFVNGTTGEGASLTTDERKQILERWIAAIDGKLKVINHVGSFSLPQSAELAAHSQACGADAIASIAPSFFKPATVEDLVQFFKPIAAAAPELPFYFYDMPSMTGVQLSLEQFLLRGREEIPTLVGVKFTHNDLMEMGACLALDNGAFEILHGYDEVLIAGVSLGAVSAVGSTYNYFAPTYLKVLEAMRQGDLATARSNQLRSIELVKVIIRYGGGVRGGKAIMNLMGYDCGPCRLPISAFSDKEYEILRSDLEAIGFFH
ncbi:MAG: dihydrodipicolinate synthase family protein [Bacilli bacterium]|jgi:N-acetylneuraminate lyase|nr:dihydrodipicolinate synthase family protein [Proteiniphilum sp.]